MDDNRLLLVEEAYKETQDMAKELELEGYSDTYIKLYCRGYFKGYLRSLIKNYLDGLEYLAEDCCVYLLDRYYQVDQQFWVESLCFEKLMKVIKLVSKNDSFEELKDQIGAL